MRDWHPIIAIAHELYSLRLKIETPYTGFFISPGACIDVIEIDIFSWQLYWLVPVLGSMGFILVHHCIGWIHQHHLLAYSRN